MTLPADSHVHSEWSWDAKLGSMTGTCERAVRIGLPAVAFTEHVDHTAWTLDLGNHAPGGHLATLATGEGVLTPPRFDAAGYLAAIDRCRATFPQLRILSGMELGEPHRHGAAIAELLRTGRFDRVLGSLHCLSDRGGFAEPMDLYPHRAAAEVVRGYLAEAAQLIAGSAVFAVLAHIDYPLRSWPAQAGPFDVYAFEDDFRHPLRVLADSGRALEINTKVPLHPEILRWWREEGGRAVTFGSDAHTPEALAAGLPEAAAMAEAHGFRPGRHAYEFWTFP